VADVSVAGREVAQVLFQPVGIRVQDQCPTAASFDAHELIVVDDLAARERAELAPDAVHGRTRA